MAVAAQGGVLPYSAYYGSPLAYNSLAYDSGAYYGAHYASPAISQYSSLPYTAVHAPAVSYAHHVPALAYSAHHVPAVAYAAAPVIAVAPAEATYTAATRGAVHTAPLPGHALSQTSLNVQAAPGTY